MQCYCTYANKFQNVKDNCSSKKNYICLINIRAIRTSGIPRGGGVFKPPMKFQSFDKAEPNSHFHGKYICNNLIRIRVSHNCKLSGTPD
jgi:hypothetical protein